MIVHLVDKTTVNKACEITVQAFITGDQHVGVGRTPRCLSQKMVQKAPKKSAMRRLLKVQEGELYRRKVSRHEQESASMA